MLDIKNLTVVVDGKTILDRLSLSDALWLALGGARTEESRYATITCNQNSSSVTIAAPMMQTRKNPA